MNQEQLIENCRKLLALVDDPEPGCATWHIACQEVAERIHAASAPKDRLRDAFNALPSDERLPALRAVLALLSPTEKGAL